MSAAPFKSADNFVSPAARERMRQHFLVDHEQHNDRWDQLWAQADFLPFDQGKPNPALVDALKDRKAIFGGPTSDSSHAQGGGVEAPRKRKRALVPGCGKGYDVLYLASLGYDAYGVDVSQHCVRQCKEFAQKHWPAYVESSRVEEHGEFVFVCGDFFKDQWLKEVELQAGSFDLIYDYTFLCALPPALRPAWAARQAELLSREGRLLCLEFPTYKEPHTGGPPFGLNSNVYLSHLGRPGEKIEYTEEGYPEDKYYHGSVDSAPTGLVRVDYWAPERTFDIGKGTDKMSVWMHQ